jgi:hypothetical protein
VPSSRLPPNESFDVSIDSVSQKPRSGVSFAQRDEKELAREAIMEMASAESIVEVSINGAFERRAIGIMNVRQALELPDMPSLSYTHPDPAKAAAGIVVTRRELERFVPS